MLSEALEIKQGEVVSLVGAGGKTSAMFRIASELAQKGYHIIATTTTKIFPPSREQADCWIAEERDTELLTRLGRAFQEHLVVVAASAIEGDGKLKGIPDEQVSKIRQLPGVFAVIVEADGAKGKSFKAPASYEPVIPSSTTIVVPVVGVDILRQRLAAEKVHRPEEVTRLTGLPAGGVITAEIIARVMLSPQGYLKGAPRNAQVIPLINKVDDDSLLPGAEELARQLLASGAKKVLLTSLRKEPLFLKVVS